jgi:DNA-binding XRE family transcriptional regulator
MEEVMTGLELEYKEDERKELAAKEFAEEVKRLRAKHNITQEQLGKLIKVQQPIMTRIENGTYGISLDLVNKIAVALHEDRHRLADVYWGVVSSEFNDPNKEVLDTIWSLLLSHYQPIPPKEPNPLSKHDENKLKKIEQSRKKLKKQKGIEIDGEITDN